MTLEQVREVLDAQFIAGSDLSDIEVTMGCGADLMSDVLAHIKAGSLLLTGLTNPQVVRTAEMSEISAICFVRGKKPPVETIDLARKNRIPLLICGFSMYLACGKLYTAGLLSCDDNDE